MRVASCNLNAYCYSALYARRITVILFLTIESKHELNQLCNAIDRGEVTLEEIKVDDTDSTVLTTTTHAEDCIAVPSPKKAKITKAKPSKGPQKV